MTSCQGRYVYISGPLTMGPLVQNVRAACEAADRLIEHGWVPFVPHLNDWWDRLTGPRDAHWWLTWDLAWLRRCDALVRLPGVSPGGDIEVDHARRHGVPVWFGLETFLADRGTWGP